MVSRRNIHRNVGTQVVSSYVPLASPNWAIIVEEPFLEAYQPIIEQLWLSGHIIIGSFVLAIVAGYFLAKRITKLIISLRNAAIQIGEVKLDTQIQVSTHDEIEELVDTSLEQAVGDRTIELNVKLQVLERMNNLMIERELKMIELKNDFLKKEIEQLKIKISLPEI